MLNFQNLKRGGKLRDSIFAPEGMEFTVADLSQIELRTTFNLAGEFEALDLLGAGGDLYSEFSTDLYGYPVSRETPVERHVGKETVLGSGFGMGGSRLYTYLLEKDVRVTPEFAEQAIKLYRSSYPGVPKLWRILEAAFKRLLREQEPFELQLGGYLCHFGFEPLYGCPGILLPSGLWIKYYDLSIDENRQWSYQTGDSRTNIFGGHFLENLCQALARCVIVEKTIAVNKLYPVVMSTHDELTAITPPGDEACAIIHNIMVKPISWLPDMPIGSETKHGNVYGAIK